MAGIKFVGIGRSEDDVWPGRRGFKRAGVNENADNQCYVFGGSKLKPDTMMWISFYGCGIEPHFHNRSREIPLFECDPSFFVELSRILKIRNTGR